MKDADDLPTAAEDQPPQPNPESAPIKTYSLEEVVAMVIPPEIDGIRWLKRRLYSGDISGYKIGSKWRMTHADVEDLIERHRNNVRPWSKRVVAEEPPEPEFDPDVPIINGKPYGGLSRRSWLYHSRAEIPGTAQYARRYGRRNQ